MRFFKHTIQCSTAPIIGTVILAALLAGCTSSPKTSVTLHYYQVGGNSIRQIDEDIRKNGPRINGNQHAVAVSNIRMVPDVALANRENGCIVKRANIKVIAKVTLPRWKNRKGAKKDIARTWDSLDRYTRLHEAVHVTIADRYARLLESQLKNAKPKKSCDLAKKNARRIIAATMRKHEREQQKFDSEEKKRFAKLARQNKS